MYIDDVMQIVLDMKGYYVKLAQGASQMHACPEVYNKVLGTLVDTAPYEPVSVVKEIIRDELRIENFDDVFEEFDPVPLGAASIGQVHSAILKKTKKPVVVKVQYPSAERNFRIDMALFLHTTKLLAPGFSEILEIFEKNFTNEFDYVREAKLQHLVWSALNDGTYKRANEVQVARPYLHDHPDLNLDVIDSRKSAVDFDGGETNAAADGNARNADGLCTKRVLVMEKLDGESIYKFGNRQLQRIGAKQDPPMSVPDLKRALRKVETEADPSQGQGPAWVQKEIEKRFGIQPPPSRAVVSSYLYGRQMLNFAARVLWDWPVKVVGRAFWDWPIALPVNGLLGIMGVQRRCPYLAIQSSRQKSEEKQRDNTDTDKNAPDKTNSGSSEHRPDDDIDIIDQLVNPYLVAELLWETTGFLMLEKGLVNGDSHSGNFMLLKNGKLGLIDFGQTRILTNEKRLKVAKLIAAVAARDEVATADFAYEAGFRTKRMNRWIASRVSHCHFGTFDSHGTGELGGVAKWEENVDRIDTITQLYDQEVGDIFLAARNCLFTGLTIRTLGLMGNNAAERLQACEGRYLQKYLEAEGYGPDFFQKQIVRGRRMPLNEKPDLSKVKL